MSTDNKKTETKQCTIPSVSKSVATEYAEFCVIMNTHIITHKESIDRANAFWYLHKDIAYVDFINGKKLYLESSGEVKIQFRVNDAFYSNGEATDIARTLNLNDGDINDISDTDGIALSNWFTLTLVDINGDTINNDLGLTDDYDDGLKLLKEVSENLYKEMYN